MLVLLIFQKEQSKQSLDSSFYFIAGNMSPNDPYKYAHF